MSGSARRMFREGPVQAVQRRSESARQRHREFMVQRLRFWDLGGICGSGVLAVILGHVCPKK